MRGGKSGKASLCCSVFHLSNWTVTAIYNTKAESDLRCGDKLMCEVRVELGLTSVWAGDDSKANKLLLLPKRVGENILSNISPWTPWEDRQRAGRSLALSCSTRTESVTLALSRPKSNDRLKTWQYSVSRAQNEDVGRFVSHPVKINTEITRTN